MHVVAFEPIYNKNTKILIMGTNPSPLGVEYGFYYTSDFNYFWSTLDAVLEIDNCDKNFVNLTNKYRKYHIEKQISKKQKTKKEIINLLNVYHIGLCDVIKECDISGGTDNQIYNDVNRSKEEIITIIKNSNIKQIFCNSGEVIKRFYKIFGGKIKAEKELKEVMAISKSPVVKIYSPSPTAQRSGVTVEKRISDWKSKIKPSFELNIE